MKCFLTGFLVTGVLFPAVVFLVPQWENYRASVETSQWLAELRLIQDAIEVEALKGKSLAGAGIAMKPPEFSARNVTYSEITEDGIILVRGGRQRQFIALIPALMNGKISWRCKGGSDGAVAGCS